MSDQNRTISVSLTPPYEDTVETTVWLSIDQYDFDEPKTGITYREWTDENSYELNGITIDRVLELYERFDSYCRGDEGVDIPIYVRCYPQELHSQYRIVNSYGVLGEGVMTTVDVDRSYDASLTNSIELDFLPVGELTFEWEDDVYDIYGTVIVAPTITLNEYILEWEGDVVGTVRVVGSERYMEYNLNIIPREGDFEHVKDAYQSTVRVFYMDEDDPRVAEHNTSPPELKGNCRSSGSRWSSGGTGDCVRRILVVNACDPSEIISERFEPMDCPST